MKVLELVESAAAGVGRHVMELTRGLLAGGHQVHVLYSDLRSDGIFAQNLQSLKIYPGFQAFQVPMRQWPGTSDIQTIHVLRQYADRRGPFDVVHCHSTKAGLIGRLGLLGQHAKRLYTPHAFFTMQPGRACLARWAAALLEAGLSRLCDRVIVVSREEYAHALALGIPAAKLSLIPNGVSLDQPRLSAVDRDAIRRKWGLRNAEVCIGFVGRLAIQKSPQTLVRSFAAMLERTTVPVRLVMIGDGPLGSSVRQLASELSVSCRISWLGACDARPLMRAFDMLALTSVSEGHPLVVLEAMGRGLPIVATRVGGISETVQHGVNGFIAPVRGVQEIAAALEILVNDPELRGRMGQASLALSRSFSVDRMVDQTVALYEQVIPDGRAATSAQDLKVAALR
jgi:glycosyltransferase involved in cell wall biosynthesis